MLNQAIGGLLPAAVGVALSPIPIIAVVLMLGTPKARSNGPAFAVGWVVGLVAVSVVVLVAAHGASDPGSSTATGVNWFQVAVGVLFLVLASRQWRGRPKPGEQAEMPKWMSTVDHFTAGKSLVLGLTLSAVNPKNLALTAAAAANIARVPGISGADEAIAIAVFVVLASTTTIGLVLFYLAAGDRATKPLASIKAFMSEHNAAIMTVVLLILGVKVLGDGLGGF